MAKLMLTTQKVRRIFSAGKALKLVVAAATKQPPSEFRNPSDPTQRLWHSMKDGEICHTHGYSVV